MEDRLEGGRGVTRSMEHWRGVTLRMGLLYEQAAVQFWGEVAASVRAGDRPAQEPQRSTISTDTIDRLLA